MSKVSFVCLFFVGFFLLKTDFTSAQTAKKEVPLQDDSLKSALKYQDSILHKAKRSDTSVNSLLDKIEYYTTSFNQINGLLSKGIDTIAISSGLPRTERGLKIIKETVSSKNNSSTLRYLYAVRDIATRLEDRLEDWQDKLSKINARLVKIQTRILEFKRDSSLSYVPSESALSKQYLEQLSVLNTKFTKLETTSRKKFLSIGLLQNRVVQSYVKITDYRNQINELLNRFNERALSKEFPYIWQARPTDYQNTLESAWIETVQMNQRLLLFFALSNYDVHIYGLLLLAFLFWVIKRSIEKITKNNPDTTTIFDQANFVPQHPVIAPMLVCGVLITFFYDHPPVIFIEIVMMMILVFTGILLKDIWPKKVYKYWILVIVLSVFYDASNLFIKICYTDRVVTLLLSMACLAGSILFVREVKRTSLILPPWYLIVFRVFVLMQTASLLLNITGRFSIAKILGVTALSGLWQAVSLFVFVRVIMETLFLYLEANKSSDSVASYFDYKTLESRLQNILKFVAVSFWLIWIAASFNIIDFLMDTSADILSQQRTIGDSKFTFGSVLIFVIVLWIAYTLSNVITYFFEFADQHAATTTRKNKLSSSILLVKLSIFGVGFLLAIIASSIPFEKINIIIGALSVGIGFGLQTIVNNLVSGVILAFEKPVQIGDIIEVGAHSGTIKEMGIRASKIATSDGSEIIIPNGDLLSQHLVNWTLSNYNRRVELIVGVAYGTDLDRVRKLLYHLVADRADVMKEPEPAVLIHTFGDNSVDFRLLFWVPDLTKWLELKSRVMSDIYEMFYKEGIEIPSPQRDIHIHYSDLEPQKLPIKEASPDNPK